MYLDSCYIAKFYLNEPDSQRVRDTITRANTLISSVWAIGEVTCAFHRHLRDGNLNAIQYRELMAAFLDHARDGIWMFIPVTERLLTKMANLIGSLPPNIRVRTGDAVHLTTALDLSEREIWTSDRHILAAAEHFGLTGRSA